MAATTVVVQQQPVVSVPHVTSWTTGLCHCCQDMSACCFAYWCFPCFTCSTTHAFGESRCLPLIDICGPAVMALFGMGFCVPPVTLSMRVAVRHKYQIAGNLCEDILISCFCIWCSWGQMNREIQHRKKPAVIMASQPVAQSAPIITTGVQPSTVVVSAV